MRAESEQPRIIKAPIVSYLDSHPRNALDGYESMPTQTWEKVVREMQRLRQENVTLRALLETQTLTAERLERGFKLKLAEEIKRTNRAQLNASILQARLNTANATIREANTTIVNLRRTATRGGFSDPNFAALGIDPNTAFVGMNEDQIEAYVDGVKRVLARIHHPDVGGSTTKMQEVNAAADKLRHPSTRPPHKR